ncbi:hypothetical protein [Streptomyces tendae]|uniref:hypothetical protein n=1 Tax=Streptomyces tendae TaxID=1932 RepID=UPI003D74EB38
MSTTNEARRRRAAVRRGERVRFGAPQPARFYVRYVRDNGIVITRSFVLEAAARKFAARLKQYGKRDVEVWENTARPRWTQLR